VLPSRDPNRALLELTFKLLVKAKNDGTGWRINEASAENVTTPQASTKALYHSLLTRVARERNSDSFLSQQWRDGSKAA
jgi:hypothetical protein